MTKRDLLLGVTALLIGVLLTWLLVRRPEHRVDPHPMVVDIGGGHDEDAPDASIAILDASIPEEDAPIELGDSSLLDPPPPPGPRARDASRPHDAHDAKDPKDRRDAAPEAAAPIVIHETNLLMHPVGNPLECVDAPSHGHTLQLYPCHGRSNQRWNFAEDTGGASRISNVDGDCVRVGQSSRGDAVPVEVGPCSADVARFRHIEGRRLQEVRSGQCITVSRLQRHARLALEPCDPSNSAQQWSLTQ